MIGNLDLDFEIWILESAIKRKIQKQILPPRNLSSGWISTKRSKIQISLISFLPFDWEIGKKDLQNYSCEQQSSFCYACACKAIVHKDSFFKSSFEFPKMVERKLQKKISPKSKSVAQLLGCTDCIVSF